ncbi:expressed unknown protein [Seminavis robusta]|uniref:CRAL-TRIO domain-containing protein n=1 Tax=Seminavis robusta TaxID=568900 RepID=A0A9N8EU67_9STRA|nr:expressed unknown protein [Seminavis robusta]|eukprot:Sro2184_g318100.1 n/a (330) ;mRNA; f:10337-11326
MMLLNEVQLEGAGSGGGAVILGDDSSDAVNEEDLEDLAAQFQGAMEDDFRELEDAGNQNKVVPGDEVQETNNGRMRLTDQEREWAINIKMAAERQPDLDNMSDFWYAQIALYDQDNVEAALHRIHNMQTFFREHKVVDNWNNGERHIRECMNAFPGFFLAFSYSPSGGNYSLVLDCIKCNKTVSNRFDQAIGSLIRSFYFLFNAASPDFESQRNGLYCITECKDFDWTKTFGLSEVRRLWEELGLVYPIIYDKLEHVHPTIEVTLLWSLTKRFLKREIHKKFAFTSCSEVARLDQIYLVPTMEAANERFLESVKEALLRRCENEANFAL